MYQYLSNLQSLVHASARKVAHAAIVPGSRRIVTVRKNNYYTLTSSLLTNLKGDKKMLKKIGITMAFIGALMISMGVTNVFAAACGCPKDAEVQRVL